MPASSAIFAFSIVPLKSGFPCQLTPTANLRAIEVLLLQLNDIADSFVPLSDVAEIFHYRKIRRIERKEKQRMVERRIRHRETLAQKEVLARELIVDHPHVAHELFLHRRVTLAHLRSRHPDQLLAISFQLGVAGRIEQIGNRQKQNRYEESVIGPVVD